MTKKETDAGDETTDARKMNGSWFEEMTETAGMRHLVCIGLEPPRDDGHRGLSTAGRTNPSAGSGKGGGVRQFRRDYGHGCPH
jgi:hypothetical protein